MLLCCITLSSSREKPTHAQEVPRRIYGAVARKAYAKSSQDLISCQLANFWRRCRGDLRQVKTYQVPIINSHLLHYIIRHLPLVFLSPLLKRFSKRFALSFTHFFALLSFVFSFWFLFACVLDCLFVMMAQDNTKLCDFSNTNNSYFISTPIAPLTDDESCEINAALLNLIMKDPFSSLPSEDV